MIQGGDPDSKNAQPGTPLGNGGPGYTVPNEVNPEYIHKRGVLAAARLPDHVNPYKASSGSQFYIVQGKPQTDAELDMVEERIGIQRATQMLAQYIKEEEEAMQKAGQTVDPSAAQERARQRASAWLKENPYRMKDEDRQIYKTIGGTPHLDGEYTVFGEVVKGMEVIDKIAEVETDDFSRPKKDVKIKKIRIK
jgi:cyclophilin family peptidyl-prolyl cis-trans isomerase